MQMGYNRAATLDNKAVPRTQYAVVRGNVRRSDADGTVTSPYFPNITPGQQLIVTHQGGTASVNLTSNILNTIIDDLNTALATNATAFDDDGCLAIKSNVLGGEGYISIDRASTAAPGLGFFLFDNIFSVGGDIPSTPEARRGNNFGSSLPTNGENLTTESINRDLTSIHSNTDILYSLLEKYEASLQKVSFSDATINSVYGAGALLLYSDVFTGFGLFSNASTETDLSPYFFFIDPATGQRALNRVVGIVRNPTGSLTYPPSGPYANASNYSSDGNVLGRNLQITTGTITGVTEGMVITVSGMSFTDIRVGNLVEISGATNVTPFSNNGMRWVVDNYRSDVQQLKLRPMSRTELAKFSVFPNGTQSRTYLNNEKGPTESFGTVTVYTGSFAANVTLVVEPPLAAGQGLDLYATVAKNKVSTALGDLAQPGLVVASERRIQSAANSVLTGGDVIDSGGTFDINPARIRFNGNVYSLPQTTFDVTESPFSGDGTYVVFFSEVLKKYTAEKVGTNTWSDYLLNWNSSGGLILAKIVVSGGSITNCDSFVRRVGDKANTLTVGTNGQFSTLYEAVSYMNAYNAVTNAFPNWEIKVLSDLTESYVATITGNRVRLYGASGSELITFLATSPLAISCEDFIMEDLKIQAPATVTEAMIGLDGDHNSITIRNVRSVGSNAYNRVVGVNNTLEKLVIRDCYFQIRTGIVNSSYGNIEGRQDIVIEDSKFYIFGTDTDITLVKDSNNGTWVGTSLVIRNVHIVRDATSDINPGTTNNAFIVDSNAAASPYYPSLLKVHLEIDGLFLDLGHMASNTCLVYHDYLTAAKITNVVFTGNIASAFLLNTGDVSDCHFTSIAKAVISANNIYNCSVSTKATTASGEVALYGNNSVFNCTLNHTDPASGSATPVHAIKAGVSAHNNLITGSFNTGIYNTPVAYGNAINLESTTHAVVAGGGIVSDSGALYSTTNGLHYSNNSIKVYSTSTTAYGIYIANVLSAVDCKILNNEVKSSVFNGVKVENLTTTEWGEVEVRDSVIYGDVVLIGSTPSGAFFPNAKAFVSNCKVLCDDKSAGIMGRALAKFSVVNCYVDVRKFSTGDYVPSAIWYQNQSTQSGNYQQYIFQGNRLKIFLGDSATGLTADRAMACIKFMQSSDTSGSHAMARVVISHNELIRHQNAANTFSFSSHTVTDQHVFADSGFGSPGLVIYSNITLYGDVLDSNNLFAGQTTSTAVTNQSTAIPVPVTGAYTLP